MPKHRSHVRASHATITQPISLDEVDCLVRISHHYERSMGLSRHIVRITAPPDVRAKFRFVVEESIWLERFALAARSDVEANAGAAADITFTPRSLVAFWGRLLASLNSRHSRRKLSTKEVALREALATKLCGAMRVIAIDDPALFDSEVATRRPAEARWMREQLAQGASDTSGGGNSERPV